MKILKKRPDHDFTVLNLTDIQLSSEEWQEGHLHRRLFEHTLAELIGRVNPDLITLSGDIAWAGNDHAYDMVAHTLEGYGIPWAPVWGNHDNQGGAEYIESLVSRYLTYPGCIYERGDKALGNGNYVILIEEEGKVVEALIMMDSHDREPFVNAAGERDDNAWARITKPQIAWLCDQTEELKRLGCEDASLIMHIPIYAYRDASAAAYRDLPELQRLNIKDAMAADCWNEGFEDSVGVQYEGIASYPADDGALEAILEGGLVKRVLVGHDHVNNFMITYRGVRLIYALKIGAGCYWNPNLNGGTVMKIGKGGVREVYHEFVDVSGML